MIFFKSGLYSKALSLIASKTAMLSPCVAEKYIVAFRCEAILFIKFTGQRLKTRFFVPVCVQSSIY